MVPSHRNTTRPAPTSAVPSRFARLGCALLLALAGAWPASGAQLLVAGERPSEYHAEPIKGENRPFVDRPRGVHRYDGLAALRTAPMPAVLVEAGVIVNPAEEARLGKSATIQRLAWAIARGADACLKKRR